ncbi:cell division protein FtsX [Desulforhabdus amnigena]|uniref:Cell division protein FtsX n=1 Tax=Desulforhabdus amnigena TaxID=40218 RepID=A0A9W6FVY4_9BACT|nr:permease-like cell division protein FtsX [Desulforhabdus amnigena]GLI35842.1 hypothetical protein DAMNIGENAA_32750 [Desulforhabdus amnigena]
MNKKIFTLLLERTWDSLCSDAISWTAGFLALSLCFFVQGLLCLAFMTSEIVAPSWMENDRATIYFRPGASAQEQDRLAQELKSWPEIKTVSLKSKEDARKEMESLLGQMKGILQDLGDNFLPSSLDIEFHSKIAAAEGTDALIEKIRQYPQVDEVLYGKGQSKEVKLFINLLKYIEFGGMGFITLVSILIIFGIGRTTVCVCHDTVVIYNLVGAPPIYNKLPFYMAGILLGMTSSFLATGGLIFFFFQFRPALPDLLVSAIPMKSSQMALIALVLLTSGIVVGWTGSWLALKKSVRF